MKNLFLTSSLHNVAHDIAKIVDLSNKNKLVFITTASEPIADDLSWLEDDRKALVNAGFEVTDYTITGKSPNQLRRDLVSFDYFYLSGGNTLYLLDKSKESGFYQIIQDLVLNKGKTYIGTSAGSIAAGPKCPDYLLDEQDQTDDKRQRGYGFVNFTIIPHWGRADFKDRYLKERLEIVYRESQVPMILLTDNQYVIVSDDDLKIVDVTR